MDKERNGRDMLELLKTRRSIRRYQQVPVDDELVETVLEAARWAPSWANTQCPRFIVVRNEQTKLALAETMGKNPAAEAVKIAPVLIVACAELKKSGFYRGEAKTDKNGSWFMFDVALAMQNLVIMAHSLGLGTVYIGAFDARKAAEILSVPEGFAVVCMSPLGYPESEGNPVSRKAIEEFVCLEKFGN